MKTPLRPANELRRQEALKQYDLLDTPPEQALDDLTALAARICQAPISLISLIDEDRQWFKSRIGLDVEQTARDISFCAHAIIEPDMFIVADASRDERFSDNPLVLNAPNIRFYAGVPLATAAGDALGTLCVIDRIPRELSPFQQEALRILARQVMSQLELRRQTRALAKDERLLRTIFDSEPECVKVLAADGSLQMMNPAGLAMIEADSFGQVAGHCIYPLIVAEHRSRFEALSERVFRGESGILEFQINGLKGRTRWLETRAAPLRDEYGQVSALLGIARDITARKYAEEQLRASAKESGELRAALDEHAIVARTDALGKIIYVNDKFCTISKYDREELLGQDHRIINSGYHPKEFIRHLWTTISSGHVWHGELKNRAKDGSFYWVDTTIVPFLDTHGKPLQYVAIRADITERKLAEEQLRASLKESADLRAALDEHAIVARTDSGGKISFVNDKFCSISQYSREELLGQDHRLINSGHHPKEFIRDLWATISAGRVWHGELKNRAKDGSFYWVDTTIVPFLDEQGKPQQYVAIRADISERKEIEKALRESNQKFHQLVDNITDVFWIRSPDMREVHYISPAFEKIWGRSSEFLYAHPEEWAEFILPEDRERVTDAFTALTKDTPSLDIEYRIVRPDNEIVWVRARGFQVRDETGQLIRLIGIVTDINEIKRAEEALSKSEGRYRTLFEYAPDGIVIANPHSVYLDANASICKMLGYTREELIGLHATDIVAEAETPNIEPALQVINAKADYHREWQFRRKDGSTFPADVIATVMPDGNLIAMIRDISERKKLEQQFLRAQRMESVGSLAGGIAHDLNNVLAPILMSVEMLREMVDGEDGLAMLDTLQTSAQRGANLVQQVLSFARGVKGQRVNVDLRHLMSDLLNVMRDTFPKSIEIHFNAGPDLWTVIGDATQLHQVFLNLGVNARDAMPEGGQLSIQMENMVLDDTYSAMNLDAHSGAYVMVKVVDTGTGIPLDIREKVFDPFFTTKPSGQGTGLGLSTTLAIVKSHGGFIHLYSEVGKGTKFKVYLPANTTQMASDQAAIAQTRLPLGNGEWILVVDDEAAIRDVAQRTLERFGYQVMLAQHGAEAVSLYARNQEKIALVLTDMAMPIMDGPALIIALKSINPQVRIIGSSGMASNGGLAKAMGAGMQHFIPKPYTAEALLRGLQLVLQGDSDTGSP